MHHILLRGRGSINSSWDSGLRGLFGKQWDRWFTFSGDLHNIFSTAQTAALPIQPSRAVGSCRSIQWSLARTSSLAFSVLFLPKSNKGNYQQGSITQLWILRESRWSGWASLQIFSETHTRTSSSMQGKLDRTPFQSKELDSKLDQTGQWQKSVCFDVFCLSSKLPKQDKILCSHCTLASHHL